MILMLRPTTYGPTDDMRDFLQHSRTQCCYSRYHGEDDVALKSQLTSVCSKRVSNAGL